MQVNVKAYVPNISSFELNKKITTTRFFSKKKLSSSAKLTLRCLIDFWNSKNGKVFPKQTTISDCTGLTRASVNKAIEELRREKLILTVKNNGRLNYYFTNVFFKYLEINNDEEPHNILPEKPSYNKVSKNIIPPILIDNKKIKNITQNSFKKSSLEGLSPTKILLAQYEKDRASSKSPYDDYDCAIKWLNSLDNKTLKNRFIQEKIQKVIEIWDLNPDVVRK